MNYETENVFNNSNPSCTEDTKGLLYKSSKSKIIHLNQALYII
jgi:hypothetical protein